MDLIITFLAAMSGALLGAAIGIYLLSPRLRPDKAELESARAELLSSERSLQSASSTVDGLRTQVEHQERALQQIGELLKEKEKQWETEVAQRTASEKRVSELLENAEGHQQQPTEAESQAAETNRRAAAELLERLNTCETQLEVDARQIRELTEAAAATSIESAALRQRAEEESRDRAALEEQLSQERSQSQDSARRVGELQDEVGRISHQLQQERQSSANRMELLVKAQENLSLLVHAVGSSARPETNGNGNGNGHHVQVVAAAAGPADLTPAPADLTPQPAELEPEPIAAVS